MKPITPDNEVIDLSPPIQWLYKCDCPQCRVGAHYNKDIAESYRKRGELNNEVARLREALELIATPMRPDGTYNRDRRACEILAKEALAANSQKQNDPIP